MSAQHIASQLDSNRLLAHLTKIEQQIQQSQPQLAGALLEYRAQLLSSQSSDDQTEKQHTQEFGTQPMPLSNEERDTLLTKLEQVAQLPIVALEREEELYLEQQLGELLGFEVSTELSGHRLPYVTGVARSVPHLKRTPTDSLGQHQRVLEAGIVSQRSHYGWQYPNSDQSPRIQEAYSVSLPLQMIASQSQESLSKTLQWYHQQKLLIINAIDQVAGVCSVVDTFIDTSGKYQYGTSPELSRDCKLWSLQNKGRMIVFFVNDRNDSITPGSYSLV